MNTKQKVLVALTSVFLLAGCNRMNFDPVAVQEAREAAAVQSNAEQVFGPIDPNQDWNSIVSGQISVTADASLDDIAKVQILTESPYFNPNARVLAEAKVTKGQTVTLNFDAPNVYTRLIAACVDHKGVYHIQGFNIGEGQVSFQKASTTRGVARRAADLPDFSQLVLEYKNSELSYNALRTNFANEAKATGDATMKDVVSQANLSLWEGSGWENERLWKTSNVSLSNSAWTVKDGTILHEVSNITEAETEELYDIFNTYLGRATVGNKKQDNMEIIRSGLVLSLYNNHLTANGVDPLIISPVLMASKDLSQCHLYYYYYDPANADHEYRTTLVDSRVGFNLTTQEAKALGTKIQPLLKQGLSPYAILQAHPEIKLSEKTLYTYIENKVFEGFADIGPMDLRRQVNRKLPKKLRTALRKH